MSSSQNTVDFIVGQMWALGMSLSKKCLASMEYIAAEK